MSLIKDSGIFPDPHAFVRERWLPLGAPEVHHHQRSLVVFGGGNRMCIGHNLA